MPIADIPALLLTLWSCTITVWAQIHDQPTIIKYSSNITNYTSASNDKLSQWLVSWQGTNQPVVRYCCLVSDKPVSDKVLVSGKVISQPIIRYWYLDM